jgi:hypothetical protein
VHQNLRSALDLVLSDLLVTTGIAPEVRDTQWSAYEGQESAFLVASDGSSSGVFILGEDTPTQVATAADTVQAWAFDELWSSGKSTAWPECPDHPDSHPLRPKVIAGNAVWCCPRTATVVDEVGRLTGTASLGSPENIR